MKEFGPLWVIVDSNFNRRGFNTLKEARKFITNIKEPQYSFGWGKTFNIWKRIKGTKRYKLYELNTPLKKYVGWKRGLLNTPVYDVSKIKVGMIVNDYYDII